MGKQPMAFYIYRRSWVSAAGRGTAFVVEFRDNGESRRRQLICPLQSGPKVNLDWTLKETEHGQEARA